MHISNRFATVCNIQIVIRMLKNIDHSITSLNTEAIRRIFNYKIGSRLQIALFLFYPNFQLHPRLFRPPPPAHTPLI